MTTLALPILTTHWAQRITLPLTNIAFPSPRDLGCRRRLGDSDTVDIGCDSVELGFWAFGGVQDSEMGFRLE